MRCFTPRSYRTLEHILSSWTYSAQSHGFEQYMTPLLDPLEIYEGKTSEEILQEQTFSFTDRGGREVVLRPEITPGVSSMMAALQQDRTIRPPYKLFSIGSVFRYEREQKGRTREHIQFNVDIFGEKELWAEAEVLSVAFSSFEHMGFSKDDFIVRLNDRREIEKRLLHISVAQEALPSLLRLLDAQKKLSSDQFETALAEITPVAWETVNSALSQEPAADEPLGQLLHVLLPQLGIPAVYDPTIVRGFDYYTGVVFEIFAKDTEKAPRSIAGGGRYDTLIASYGGDSLPAVGFGMGDVLLGDLLSEEDGFVATEIVLCGPSSLEGLRVAHVLRSELGFYSSYIGMVPEDHLSRIYKYYESEGVLYVLSLSENGVGLLRDLTKRTSIEIPLHANSKELARSLQDILLPPASL